MLALARCFRSTEALEADEQLGVPRSTLPAAGSTPQRPCSHVCHPEHRGACAVSWDVSAPLPIGAIGYEHTADLQAGASAIRACPAPVGATAQVHAHRATPHQVLIHEPLAQAGGASGHTAGQVPSSDPHNVRNMRATPLPLCTTGALSADNLGCLSEASPSASQGTRSLGYPRASTSEPLAYLAFGEDSDEGDEEGARGYRADTAAQLCVHRVHKQALPASRQPSEGQESSTTAPTHVQGPCSISSLLQAWAREHHASSEQGQVLGGVGSGAASLMSGSSTRSHSARTSCESPSSSQSGLTQQLHPGAHNAMAHSVQHHALVRQQYGTRRLWRLHTTGAAMIQYARHARYAHATAAQSAQLSASPSRSGSVEMPVQQLLGASSCHTAAMSVDAAGQLQHILNTLSQGSSDSSAAASSSAPDPSSWPPLDVSTWGSDQGSSSYSGSWEVPVPPSHVAAMGLGASCAASTSMSTHMAPFKASAGAHGSVKAAGRSRSSSSHPGPHPSSAVPVMRFSSASWRYSAELLHRLHTLEEGTSASDGCSSDSSVA